MIVYANRKIDLYKIAVSSFDFEEKMDNYFGCEIAKVVPGSLSDKTLKLCRSIVRHYGYYIDVPFFKDLAKKVFGANYRPSAMYCHDLANLTETTLQMRQIMYAHYLLGKHNNMKESFPKSCCQASSCTVLAAFWEAGFVSSVIVSAQAREKRHYYIITPFIVGNYNYQGVIVADPTSDQLYTSKSPRNDVMIEYGKWKYITDWQDRADLYPNEVRVCTQHGFLRMPYKPYIQQALKNPAEIR